MQHCLFYSCAIKFYFELWVLSFYHITPKAIQSTQFRSYGQHLSFSSLFCTMDSRYLKHELKFYCKYFHKTNSNGNEIKWLKENKTPVSQHSRLAGYKGKSLNYLFENNAICTIDGHFSRGSTMVWISFWHLQIKTSTWNYPSWKPFRKLRVCLFLFPLYDFISYFHL